MKKNEIKKKMGALGLSAAMVMSIGAPATVFAAEDAGTSQSQSQTEKQSKFVLNPSSLSNRVRFVDYVDITGMQLQLGFKERNDDGDVLFTNQDCEAMLEHGFVRINNGKWWSFKDAGLVQEDWGNGKSISSFQTTNIKFLKSIINEDTYTISIKDPNGGIATLRGVKNTMDADERKKAEAELNTSSEVNKQELKTLISQCEALNAADYTADSFSAMNLKLEEAKRVDAKSDVTQEQVDEAYTNLKAKFDTLEQKPSAEGDMQWSGTLKDNWGTLRFGIELKGEGEGTSTKPILKDEDTFINTTNISINGKSYGTMKSAGFIAKHYPGDNSFYLEDKENLAKFKSIINENTWNVVLTTADNKTYNITVTNELAKEQRDEIAGTETPAVTVNKDVLNKLIETAETKKAKDYTKETFDALTEKLQDAETVSANDSATEDEVNTATNNLQTAIDNLAPAKPVEQGVFYNADVTLMHSKGDVADYPYTQTSMSGAVLDQKAQIVKFADGSYKLIMHFAPTYKIMGRYSYATGLDLTTSGLLKENQKGDINTKFILSGDNTGICIVDLPNIDNNHGEEIIYEGYIYSNQMNANVALRINHIEKDGTSEAALKALIKKAEAKLNSGKNYYDEEKTALENAIAEAKTTTEYGTSYIKVSEAMTKLVEKVKNPFSDPKEHLYWVGVKGSKVSKDSLYKWGKVTTDENGKATLTVQYLPYSEWYGLVWFSKVKVLDKDGQPIEVNYKVDKDKNGTLSFVLPEVPESGIIKVKLTEGESGRENDCDLILNYKDVHKGLYVGIFKDSIKRYDEYQKDDWVTKGSICDDLEDAYTNESFAKYKKAIEAARAELTPEGLLSLTQEKMNKDIEAIIEAKEGLVFKVKAGHGNTANLGTSGINNPKNFYEMDKVKFAFHVGWGGSKILFGKNNDVYKVLNDGNAFDENGQKIKTGKLFILSENGFVTKPFTENEGNVPVRWDNSIARAYLNGEYYNNNFSDLEKSIITDTELKTEDYNYNMTPTDTNTVTTTDKIFYPSISDYRNGLYGFATGDARDLGTSYDSRNLQESALGDWVIAGIKSLGRIDGLNMMNSKEAKGLPAMNIDASKILMTLKADQDIPEGLAAPQKTQSNIWKLILIDDSVNFEISSPKMTSYAATTGKEVNFTANKDAGDVYAMVVEGNDYKTGKLKSFGKVGDAASGNVDINLPADFDISKDKLYLFQMKSDGAELVSSVPKTVNVTKDDIENAKNALENAKAEKNKKIDALKLTDAQKKGKTEDSIKAAEDKLKELKDAAKKEVEDAKTVDAVNNVAVPSVDSAVKLLKDKSDSKARFQDVPVTIEKPNGSKSMADKAIDHKAKVIKVTEDGKIKYKVRVTFKPMSVGKLKGNIIGVRDYGAKVIKTYKAGKDNEDTYKVVEFTLDSKMPKFKIGMEVDVMDQIQGQPTWEEAYVVLDWKDFDNSLKPIDPADIDKIDDKDSGKVTPDDKGDSSEVTPSDKGDTDTANTDAGKKVDIESVKDGKYVADVLILKDDKNEPSMANNMFVNTANIEIKGDKAIVKFYVVRDLPKFSNPVNWKYPGKGSVLDFYLMYNGQKYMGKLDASNHPLMPMRETNAFFGLVKGQKMATNIYTFELPKEALTKTLKAGAFVNMFMKRNVEFRVKLSDFRIPTGHEFDGSNTDTIINSNNGKKTNLPNTGDEANTTGLMAMIMAGFAGIAGIFAKKKSK